MIQVALVAVLAMLVAGCGQRSASPLMACVSAIEANEKFPSTMQLVSNEVQTKKVTADEFANELAGDFRKTLTFAKAEAVVESAPNITIAEITSYPSGKGYEQASYLRGWLAVAKGRNEIALQTQHVEYDIDNGNGVPERKSGSCVFAVDSASGVPLVDHNVAVRLEKLRKQQYGLADDVPNKGWPCCLPRFAIVSEEVTGVAGRVKMADEIELEVRKAMEARDRRGL